MIDNSLYMWDANPEDPARLAFLLRMFHNKRLKRVNFESMWEESASLAWPEYRGTFTYLHERPEGVKQTQYQVDSSAAIASHRFMAVVAYMLNLRGLRIKPSDAKLLADKPTKQWFDDVSRILLALRYDSMANFDGPNQTNCQSLGVFGNMGMWTEEWNAPHIRGHKGLAYRTISVGEFYPCEGHQGRIEGGIRHFRRTAAQAAQMWPDTLPPVLQVALERNSPYRYNFLHFVLPRTTYLPWELLTPKSMPYASMYVSVEGYCFLEEGGYRSLPATYARYMQAPEEDYGRGPAQMVLPALKTLNAIKVDYLTAGHKAASPAYLIGDDGLFDFKSHAGAYNYTQFIDGKPQVALLPTGDFKVADELIAHENRFVQDAFLVSLYRDLFDDAKQGREMSARQVVERAVDRGIFIAPLGTLYSQYCGPMIDRELDLASEMRLLPPMPPLLKEARGAYEPEYDSPISRSVAQGYSAATMQLIETMSTIAQATGSTEIFDAIELDEATRVIGEGTAVPERVFASIESKNRKAKARQQAQQQEQETKQMPAKAAIIKAQAIAAKAQAGQNIGGTLSGVPQEQMPEIPQGGP